MCRKAHLFFWSSCSPRILCLIDKITYFDRVYDIVANDIPQYIDHIVTLSRNWIIRNRLNVWILPILCPRLVKPASMSKRKNNEPTSAKSTTNPDSSDDDVDMDANEEIQVAFEWCNFDAEVDFLGLKNLLREQFDIDHDVINLSGLADLILSQAEIGTTVKCGAEDDASEEIHKTDPYAYITILNLHNLKVSPIVIPCTSNTYRRALT